MHKNSTLGDNMCKTYCKEWNFLREYKVLNINGAVLEKNQLEEYLKKIASDHVLQNKSDKETFPIPRVRENYEFIQIVYKLLNEHIKSDIPIHPAGEWILDNFYIIEKTVKTIAKELTLKKYTNYLGIASGQYKGFARVYVLACEIIAYTDAKIDSDNLADFLRSYQTKNSLSMDEIWSIGMFMQVALIENIRRICEKIYSAQIQKYKVENIIERLLENKDEEGLKFKNLPGYKTKILGYGEMKYPFIEYMSYRLKSYGKQSYSFISVLENQVEMMGTNIQDVIKKEHFDIAVKKVSMGNSITSINTLNRLSFLEIFEQINGVEEILKNDPVNVYDKMDYKTKEYYRNVIMEISKKTKISEIYIAKKSLELARNAYNLNKEIDDVIAEKKAHVGYYLIGDGNNKLLETLLNKKIERSNTKTKSVIYISVIYVITSIICVILAFNMSNKTGNALIGILCFILIFIPIQTIVVKIIQYILGKFVKPRLIPKLDFSNGIPKEYGTMIIIPTILKDRKKVREVMKKLEIYYLANKSENLYFCLLGDVTSSKNKNEKHDEEVIDEGIKIVKELNEKYKTSINKMGESGTENCFPIFNFIYRERNWNSSESNYIGWERKRGYINQFNRYILGKIDNPFKVNTIESCNIKIPKIKYVITLDADTELILNSGLELVGAMAHVLNIPVLNKEENLVIDGHALMQPRVGISLEDSRKTLFTKIFGGMRRNRFIYKRYIRYLSG